MLYMFLVTALPIRTIVYVDIVVSTWWW